MCANKECIRGHFHKTVVSLPLIISVNCSQTPRANLHLCFWICPPVQASARKGHMTTMEDYDWARHSQQIAISRVPQK